MEKSQTLGILSLVLIERQVNEKNSSRCRYLIGIVSSVAMTTERKQTILKFQLEVKRNIRANVYIYLPSHYVYKMRELILKFKRKKKQVLRLWLK